ncbi:MAG: S41 family peptidase [Thermoanaerobacteraceae bacterium]|uniref:S41 family peptidase n=1 Tax=Thermanaeromonas sp. C210 TaxID=2731925 RepID=UPI00155D2D4C|nr:S41 family peptidase [Thermanaeromonas sp. C210]MBE3581823.1 S41 family peptidase [Thermoanaerobacteraceae bacterium]GFN22734.1 peptidase [Thermanaeromonas sp. C210]
MRKTWRRVVYGLLALCVLVTAGLVVAVAAHYQRVQEAVRVYSLVRWQSLNPVPVDKLLEGAIKGMVEALDDPYSSYLPPDVYRRLEEHVQGTYGGVGLLITLEEEDRRLVVVSPFKGSPAWRAGIKSGDYILAIDDRDTAGMDLDTAASLMQGEPGTRVQLTVLTPGAAEPRKITLVRENIKIPTVDGRMLPAYPGIGYISLSMINEQTGRDLGQLLGELRGQGLRGLVLDLRNNPGGSLHGAVEVASYFVPRGPVVYIVDQKRTEALEATGHNIQVPLVVLINKGSASAAEIIAGAIKDTGSGVLVGETSFGKGVVQTLFELKGGAAVKLTTHKYLTPAKRDIDKTGITPDYQVPLDPQVEQEVLANPPDLERDAQLKKAVEILQAKLAERPAA